MVILGFVFRILLGVLFIGFFRSLITIIFGIACFLVLIRILLGALFIGFLSSLIGIIFICFLVLIRIGILRGLIFVFTFCYRFLVFSIYFHFNILVNFLCFIHIQVGNCGLA